MWEFIVKNETAAIITLLSFVIMLILHFVNKKRGKQAEKVYTERYDKLLEEIKKVQPQYASKELKEEIHNVVEKIAKPTTAEDWFIKAWSAQVDENYDKAIVYYERIIEYKPNFIDVVYNNLGNVLIGKKDFDKAIDYFNKGINTTSDALTLNAINYNMGLAYRRNGEYSKAIECYKKVIEIEPTNVELYIIIANLFDTNDDLDNALQYYHKAAQIEPKDARIYYEVSVACMKHAEKLFKNAVSHTDLLLADNWRNTAIKHLQRAAQLGDAKSQELLSKLDEV